MELQFAKTAPGVMTASWTHPKKGRHYSIAIIESCDTQHLFIDGELIARELPTFEDAVTLARQKLESGRSSQLVRIASGLVLASVIGASIIVASKFMPAITASEIAAVTPAVTTPAEAGAKPLDAANDGAGKVASSAPLPASTVATKTVVIEPPPTPAPAPSLVAASGSDPAPASTGEPRRFSARYNLLALQAHADEQREAARKETDAKPEPAHALASDPAAMTGTLATTQAPTLAPTQPAERVPAPAAPSRLSSESNTAPASAPPVSRIALAEIGTQYSKPLVRPMFPVAAANVDDATIEQADASAPGRPPLPTQAPEANPLVKVAATVGDPTPKRETKPPLTRQQSATEAPRAEKGSKKKASRPASRRKSGPLRRSRPSTPRRVVTAGPQKHLVCFAHVCRWR